MLSYDVVVVGGGPAGIASALAAADEGCRVALLEKYGCLGGGITSGYVRPFLGLVNNPNIGGEIRGRIAALEDFMSPVEAAKVALAEMLHERGVDVRLQTEPAEVMRDGANITRIAAVSKGGRYEFCANAYIDATGDGDLAAMAGARCEYGREGDRLVQPTSIMFTIEGIDPSIDWCICHEEDWHTLPDGREFLDICHKACESGELPPSINIVRLYATGRVGERMVNATQANHVNPLEPTEIFAAEVELRRQVRIVVEFLRRNIPGFEHIRVNGSATTLGARESRRIIGDYILTDNDLIIGARFDDAIVHRANFCIDIHNPDGAGQAERNGRPYLCQDYDIPYRSLTPLGFDNLLCAGRNISGDHRAHASYRVMNICMAMGHAAGLAAADISRHRRSSRDVDIRAIQKKLGIVKPDVD
ncbi:MAG TPA: FAD-dependent oxidoreductase [Firmicutes bacterium]|nr:FAD-dependent oxidoreductase [Bacillota bacterium]